MSKEKKINTRKSQKLWKEAKKIIPGGSQLLSKRAEMSLPELWPAYFREARGVNVIDIDGNKYIDMTHMSVGACTLGYCDPDVNRAVKQVIDDGTMSSLNAPEEVELARMLLDIHPWAKMVRYARSGGEAMSIAIRIARAYTGKDKIAFCGYHGWHDWYLSTNLVSKDNLNGQHLSGLSTIGVPKNLAGTAIPFHYNKIEELEAILKVHDVGIVVMEPIRHQEPKDDFLKKIRDITTKKNIVLVFDEISSGFRLTLGGAHLLYEVEPDIVIFSKAISNGYPMAAIIGRGNVMDIAQESFISSTYWTERVGFVAALATIKKMRKKKVPHHLDRIGKMIEKGWIRLAKKHHLNISVEGPTCLITFSFNYDNKTEIRTLFTQEMLRRGFLAGPSVYVSYAHKEAHVTRYLKAIDEVFSIIKDAITTNTVKEKLEGPVVHVGFARLT